MSAKRISMKTAAYVICSGALALTLSSCATTYRPKPESLTMTPAAARKALRKNYVPMILANGDRTYGVDATSININFTSIKIAYVQWRSCETPFHNIEPSAKTQSDIHGTRWILVLDFKQPQEGKTGCAIYAKGRVPRETAHGFVDALTVLSREAAERDAALAKSDADLAKEVAAYKATKTPSDSDEQFRRLKAQAEGALREKNFEEAAEYYDLALKAAPAWAAGRFNFALVLAEIQDYRMAIAEMKKYLLLSPDAPDAQKVRDRIYDWERKLG